MKDGATLSLRLIARGEGDADTVALIDFPLIDVAPRGADPVAAKPAPAAMPVALPDHGLRKDLHRLKMELEARGAELDALRAAAGRMEIHWQAKLAAALADAETGFRRAEALRLAAAKAELEEIWTRKLSAARAEIREPQDLKLLRLDLVAAKNALMAGKAEQARLQGELENERQKARAGIAAIRAEAETAKAAALNQTEAALTAQSDKRLAALKARLETAETALAARDKDIARLTAALEEQQGHAEAAKSAASSRALHDDAYVRGLEREIKSLRASLVAREADIALDHAREQRSPATPQLPALHWQPLSNRIESRRSREKPSHLFRDMLIVMALAGVAVLFLPRIEASLPNDLRWQIETLDGLIAPEEPQTPKPAPPKPAPQEPLPPPATTVSRAVNLRGAPSATAAIIAGLNRGATVAILDKRGHWDHVRVPGGPVQEGWVYDTYLDMQAAKP